MLSLTSTNFSKLSAARDDLFGLRMSDPMLKSLSVRQRKGDRNSIGFTIGYLSPPRILCMKGRLPSHAAPHLCPPCTSPQSSMASTLLSMSFKLMLRYTTPPSLEWGRRVVAIKRSLSCNKCSDLP